MKAIGIVGSRERDSEEDYRAVRDKFWDLYEPGDYIVSGGCPRGGDRFAERLAQRAACTIVIHRADWESYGRAAGPVRNTLIAKECDVLISSTAPGSRGAADTVRKVRKLGKPAHEV